MRKFVLATCFAAALAFVPVSGNGQTAPYSAPGSWEQRPPPPTEPSIPVVEKLAAAKPQPAVRKPALRHKIVRRRGKGPAGPVTMPSPDALVMMVRGALACVNQANFTENYSVLRGMATPSLQARATPAQFGKAFVGLRKQNLDLSPVLVLPPHFTASPALGPHGVLRLAGFFPSRPLQIGFAIDYLPVDGFWLIDAISVSALPAAAPAPKANPAMSAFPTADRLAGAPVP